MAQHDYNLVNQSGADFRADLNNALSAIATNNSGANQPSTTFAYEWWIDTTNNVIKLRNSANNAWITLPISITADNTVDINAGTVNGITSLSFSSGSTVTTILDEDNLASDSATALATQQSIKAYVDSQVTAQDLDISDGSSAISIDLDSESLGLLGGTGVTSTASGNNVTFAIGQSVGTGDDVVFNQVTSSLVGNATTATALATARAIALSGDVVGTANFDGSAGISISTTIQANSVALGTDTTGNYVATIAGTTNEIEVSGSGSETAAVTVGLPDNVVIAGNLTVNGTTTTVNTETLSVEDPLIKLANNNSSSDTVDIGFYGLYDTSGSQDLFAGLFRDANDSGKFKLFKDLQSEPTTTVNTSGTGYATGTLVADLEGNINSTLTSNLSFADNSKSIFGAGNDLQIYHDGSNSYIKDLGTGSLIIQSSDNIKLQAHTGEFYFQGIRDGAAKLYFDNAEKLLTTTTGVSVSGGTSSTLLIDASTHDSSTANTAILNFGFGHSGSPDAIGFIKLTENGTNSFNGTMTFGVPKNNGSGGSTTNTVLTIDEDGDTTFTGDVTLTGASADIVFDKSDNALEFATNAKAVFGDSLTISRIGNSSYIHETGSGDLYIKGSDIYITDQDNNQFIHLDDDGTGGTVRLKHEGSTKLATTSTGVSVTGNIANASGDMTIDVAGDLFLDADGAGIFLSDGGTSVGRFLLSSSDLTIGALVQDKDIKFAGNDGGSAITALTLDMSASGAATFNDQITLGGNLVHAGNFTVDAGGDITLDADGGDVIISDGGSEKARFSSGNLAIGNTSAGAKLDVRQDSGTAFRCEDGSGGYFVVKHGGQTGIGTSSPANFLDVQQASSGSTVIYQFQNTSNTADSHSRLKIATGGTSAGDAILQFTNNTSNWYINPDTSDSYKLKIGTSISDSKLVVDTSGNIGIGTTSPSSHLTLHGNMRFNTTNADGNEQRALFNVGGSADPFSITGYKADATTVGMVLNSGGVSYFNGGNVGIGTTSPATKLHVSAESTNANTIVRLQQGTTAGNYSAIEVGRTDGSGNVHLTSAVTGGIPIGGIPGILLGSENTSIPAVAIQTPNSSNGHIVFNPKGTEKARITSDGYLLVGKTDTSFTTNGTEIRGGNLGARIIRQNAEPLTLHRQGSDGEVINLFVDSTQIGSLGTSSSDLVLTSSVSDKDIIFKGNDGGSSITALTLDMSDAGTATFNHDVKLGDDGIAKFGTGNDLQIYHDGSDSYINGLGTGNVIIRNSTDDADILFQTDNGSGSVTTYMTLDGSAVTTFFNKNTRHTDNIRATFGSSSDLQIYHDGSNSFISETGTGNLYIQGAGTIRLRGTTTEENLIEAVENGAVSLYHDNSVKLATTSTGVDVTGVLAVNSGTTDTAATFTSSDTAVAVNFVASDNSMQIATSSTDGIIKNNGAGSFRFFNNGSEAARINSSGLVGIGLTSPSSPLTIKSSATHSGGGLRIIQDSGTNVVASLFGGVNSGTRFGRLELSETSGDAINVRISADPSLTSYINAGNFGIGDTNPSAIRLSVVTPTANHVGLQVENSNTADSFGMIVKGGNDANDYTADFRKRDNTGIMRIRGDGNIGIGTTSPSEKLEVAGNIKVGSGGIVNSDTFNNRANSANIIYRSSSTTIVGNNANALVVADAGNIGIGTSSPQGNLHVEGAAGASGGGIIYVTDADNGSTASDALHISKSGDTAFVYNRESSGDLQLGAGNTAGHVVIKSSGNVGIGTTAPSQKLHVDGIIASQNSAQGTGLLQLQGYGNTAYINHTGSSNLHFRMGSGFTTRMTLTNAGNLGVGTSSPASLLTVEGDIRQTTGDLLYGGGGNWDIKHLADDQNIVFYTSESGSATEKMRIKANGAIGIGTSSPSASHKLTVGGDTKFTGQLSMSDNQLIKMGDSEDFAFYHDTSIGNVIKSSTSDMDISILGNDGGSTITALSFDMSAAGAATFNSSVTATTYATSSDARLKDVTGTARGLEVINKLNPVAYNWKADGKADEGLIAQEVKELVPNAVVGSEADMYSMDYSKLVVHLVAGMQEQQAIIEDLQTQLNKLKR